MKAAFLQYVQTSNLLHASEKTLLAVSGGLDSCAMVHLFHQAGFPFGIAHCNFQLRAKASDEDEAFVRQLAIQYGVPFFSISFETERIASQSNESIQMVARRLRYEWLESIQDYLWIATAHHLNDSIETLFLNLIRGCGIGGLHGIPSKSGRIIRPLSFASRAELEAYAKQEQLLWREDASNSSVKYRRNKIRHQVIPTLQEMNPALENTFAENFRRFRETEYWYQRGLDAAILELILPKERGFSIDKNALIRYAPGQTSLLFAILNPLGFSDDQLEKIPHSVVGARFFSESHCLLNDREFFLVEENEQPEWSELQIPASGIYTWDKYQIHIERIEGIPERWPDSPQEALLDADQLDFPLTLRYWREGDTFQPLGMGGQHQKVQDFFSNQKIDRFEKARIPLLINRDGQIAWIVGWRISEAFKINSSASRAFYYLKFGKV
ncbi:MAG TPA: tRNA lysidine(34) synthetase TilS [Saprospiraceae bacterium]|nr:tRNA lysidine(34) synthetase TilS [Saprospiraceae bacterium]HMQ84555.1 tRNA lysidine(34) synthetase TilS [Saprospiraceae bacterium]